MGRGKSQDNFGSVFGNRRGSDREDYVPSELTAQGRIEILMDQGIKPIILSGSGKRFNIGDKDGEEEAVIVASGDVEVWCYKRVRLYAYENTIAVFRDQTQGFIYDHVDASASGEKGDEETPGILVYGFGDAKLQLSHFSDAIVTDRVHVSAVTSSANIKATGEAYVKAGSQTTVDIGGNAVTVSSGKVNAKGNSTIIASGQGKVNGTTKAKIIASDSVKVRAKGDCVVDAYGESEVIASESVTVNKLGPHVKVIVSKFV